MYTDLTTCLTYYIKCREDPAICFLLSKETWMSIFRMLNHKLMVKSMAYATTHPRALFFTTLDIFVNNAKILHNIKQCFMCN